MLHNFQSATEEYSYPQFVQLLKDLLSQGKTTGNNQSEEYLHYAKLNMQRMQRLDKVFELREDVKNLVGVLPVQVWYVITEGWCGDSAQNLPMIAKMAEHSAGRIDLRIILRDENLAIMDQYLTNGSRSIPVVVAFDESGKEMFRWGPRPAAAQELLNKWKSEVPQRSFEDFELEMHTWYTKDKGNTLQDEWMRLLSAEK